jgi:hypothetical protein
VSDPHRIQAFALSEGFFSYNCIVTDIGKMLLVLGLVVAAAGLVLILVGRTNLPFGRLPGDILYRGKHTTFYFPLATSILVSVVLSLVLYLVGKLRH